MLICISISVLPHGGGEGKHCYYAVLFVFCHTVEGIEWKKVYFTYLTVFCSEGAIALIYLYQCFATACKGEERRMKLTI